MSYSPIQGSIIGGLQGILGVCLTIALGAPLFMESAKS